MKWWKASNLHHLIACWLYQFRFGFVFSFIRIDNVRTNFIRISFRSFKKHVCELIIIRESLLIDKQILINDWSKLLKIFWFFHHIRLIGSYCSIKKRTRIVFNIYYLSSFRFWSRFRTDSGISIFFIQLLNHSVCKLFQYFVQYLVQFKKLKVWC